jgi:acyl carrier protein
MNREWILGVVRRALTTVLHLPGPPAENDRLFEELGMDSLALTELVVALEEDLGRTIDLEEMDLHHFLNPVTLTDYLVSTAKASRAGSKGGD